MNSRRKNRVADRRRQVAECALKGLTQEAIGALLSVSQATVARDLGAIRQEWRKSAIRDFDEARGQQLQKLALVESEAWAAWQRSQGPIKSGSLTESKGGTRKQSSLKHQHGDPRFLEQINKCITQRCLLLALQPAAAPLENDPHAGLSLEIRRERVLGFITGFHERQRAEEAGARHDDDQPGGAGHADQPGEVASGAAPVVPGPGAAAGD
ncbi:MAG TPA: ECF-type sigma factor [Planctomycetaceae bacterium]|jgi:hypothetical protein